MLRNWPIFANASGPKSRRSRGVQAASSRRRVHEVDVDHTGRIGGEELWLSTQRNRLTDFSALRIDLRLERHQRFSASRSILFLASQQTVRKVAMRALP